MERPYRHLYVRRDGDLFCAHLRQHQLDESQLMEMCAELLRLLDDGCRRLVLSLGPPDPEFLYSVFLAKLVSLQRRLNGAGGALKLAHVSPDTWKIFEACRLHGLFDFVPDEAAGIQQFTQTSADGDKAPASA
jgi:hypothetical protein